MHDMTAFEYSGRVTTIFLIQLHVSHANCTLLVQAIILTLVLALTLFVELNQTSSAVITVES